MQLISIPGYIIEPLPKGSTRKWEGHHATNPCCLRLPCDGRVFLGYRAGGMEDWFRCGEHIAWASHLGLAVLDESGESVVCRLPLPIMKIDPAVPLPKSLKGYDAYEAGPERDRIAVLHDFRFWEDSGWLYVIFHEGTVSEVFDCIVRMRSEDFIRRVDASIALAGDPVAEIEEAWREMWWAPGIWEPAGINGTNRIYGSKVVKNDIVFIRRTDGGVMMFHRPAPDIAVVDTRGNTYAPLEEDGMAAFGSLQTCIRPGRSDNSHIGNNGTPIPVVIGQRRMFLDIVHGVRNERISLADESGGWKLTYEPYLRLLDGDTGRCLYYSEEPILPDDPWQEYTRYGTWVSDLPHLDSVMFAGGQTPRIADRNGLEDEYQVYFGVGDTAVARATFRLRDLLPEPVVRDLLASNERAQIQTRDVPEIAFVFSEPICDWNWSLINSVADREAGIVRELERGEGQERNVRPVEPRPGYFDGHGIWIPEQTPIAMGDWGWVVVYHGLRWDEDADSSRRTEAGLGVMVLDRSNPERILYRSTSPIGPIRKGTGWSYLPAAEAWDADELLQSIPDAVADQGAYIHRRQPMPSNMTRWLVEKAQAATQFSSASVSI